MLVTNKGLCLGTLSDSSFASLCRSMRVTCLYMHASYIDTCQTPVYILELPCTCIRIFNLSKGATAVRDLRNEIAIRPSIWRQFRHHGIGLVMQSEQICERAYNPPATPPAMSDLPIEVHVKDFAVEI